MLGYNQESLQVLADLQTHANCMQMSLCSCPKTENLFLKMLP